MSDFNILIQFAVEGFCGHQLFFRTNLLYIFADWDQSKNKVVPVAAPHFSLNFVIRDVAVAWISAASDILDLPCDLKKGCTDKKQAFQPYMVPISMKLS
jgi:hypothetical protein